MLKLGFRSPKSSYLRHLELPAMNQNINELYQITNRGDSPVQYSLSEQKNGWSAIVTISARTTLEIGILEYMKPGKTTRREWAYRVVGNSSLPETITRFPGFWEHFKIVDWHGREFAVGKSWDTL